MAKTGKRKRSRPRRRRQRGGKIDFQKAIEKTSMEFHIPDGYNYSGPGTKLAKRLKRGDWIMTLPIAKPRICKTNGKRMTS